MNMRSEQRRIVSLTPLKEELRQRLVDGRGVFSPLELYLHPVWQAQFIPEKTVYVTAAASSGGYRAYLERWGANGSEAWKPNGHRQHTIIGMNTALVKDMVGELAVPSELADKQFVIPHEIGTGIPPPHGTLMGRNEADLMMHWMMRIAGVGKQDASRYYETMMTQFQHVRETIGNPAIAKADKIDSYVELIKTFFDTLRNTSEPVRPVSAIVLGLDWSNSLGSRLEAAAAHALGIPLYEMVFDENHPDFENYMHAFLLTKIRDRIHLPTVKGNGQQLLMAAKTEDTYIKRMCGPVAQVLFGAS